MTAVGRFEMPPSAVRSQTPAAATEGNNTEEPQPQPQRLVVYFDKLVLRPVFPERQLAAWLGLLAAHNPAMRPEDGVLEIPLGTPPPKGSLDYIVMTKE